MSSSSTVQQPSIATLAGELDSFKRSAAVDRPFGRYHPYLHFNYISHKGLENLRDYKYRSGLSGYLDRVIMTPFWEYCVTLVPLWMAPNLITTISLACAVLAYALLAYYTPNLEGDPPSWAFYVAAALMFLYQTLDAIDGKQARRTGSSSPLGQLFDHGCDAICAIFTGLFLGSCTSSGNSYLSLALLYIAIVPFYVSNWEEATTGFMRFGIIGVTEAQLSAMGVLTFTGLLGGTKLWDTQMLPGCTLKTLFLVVGLFGVVYQCVTSVWTVLTFIDSKPKPSLLAVQQSAIQIVEFFAFIALSTMLVMSPHSRVYSETPRLPLWVIGLLSSYQVSRLIICHVTLDPYSPFWSILWPLPVVVLNAWLHVLPLSEYMWLYLYLVMIAVMYAHFIYVSIHEITSFLGIRCFHIKVKQRRQSTAGNVGMIQHELAQRQAQEAEQQAEKAAAATVQ